MRLEAGAGSGLAGVGQIIARRLLVACQLVARQLTAVMQAGVPMHRTVYLAVLLSADEPP